ncbi:MAG: antitoxin family protein [Microcystis aeruginosa LG13-03]|nr:antitoxin family protein [Microcystis aeruginosa LG13-13]NCR03156.1 antitoxin family protein [Microcystis aeruginosa LG13-03]NCR61193.1 antitoxin family protein [Microcystis aeruginosa LG11-05]
MMPQALEAVFDGTALQLEEPLNLAAGTRVTIIIGNFGSETPPF